MLTIDFNAFSLSSADDGLLRAADAAIAMHRAEQPGHGRERDAAMHEGELSWRPYFEFLPDVPCRVPEDDGESWSWLRSRYGALGLNGMPFATAAAFASALHVRGMDGDEAMARALSLETVAHVAREMPVEFAHALLAVAPKRYRPPEHPRPTLDPLDAPFNAWAIPGVLPVSGPDFSHALHDAALVGIWGVKRVDGPNGERVDIPEDVWKRLAGIREVRGSFIADPDEPEF